jgi:hypothetical protein
VCQTMIERSKIPLALRAAGKGRCNIVMPWRPPYGPADSPSLHPTAVRILSILGIVAGLDGSTRSRTGAI